MVWLPWRSKKKDLESREKGRQREEKSGGGLSKKIGGQEPDGTSARAAAASGGQGRALCVRARAGYVCRSC